MRVKYHLKSNYPYPYICMATSKSYRCIINWDGKIQQLSSSDAYCAKDGWYNGKIEDSEIISKNKVRDIIKRIKLETL